jgi:hypothetical protein
MLPKPEKKTKKDPTALAGEQLNLLEPVDRDKQVRQSRQFLSVVLGFTIIPSLLFWAYRSFKNFSPNSITIPPISFNLPQFPSLPHLSPPVLGWTSSSSPDFDHLFTETIGTDSGLWSVYMESEISGKNISWQRHLDQFGSPFSPSTILNRLQKLSPVSDSFISMALPQGAQIRQEVTSLADYDQYHFLINLPRRQVLLLFKVSGSASRSSATHISPSLVKEIYWQLTSQT